MQSVCRVYVECMLEVYKQYIKGMSKLMKYRFNLIIENYFYEIELRSIILKNSSKMCVE
jgi:hypothetical protein